MRNWRERWRVGGARTTSLVITCALGGLTLLGSGCGGSDDPPPARVEVLVTATSIKAQPSRVQVDTDSERDVVFVVTDRGQLITPFWVRGHGEEQRVQIYPGKTSSLETSVRPGVYQLGTTDYGTAAPMKLRVGPASASPAR
jgi:hypothetical protein